MIITIKKLKIKTFNFQQSFTLQPKNNASCDDLAAKTVTDRFKRGKILKLFMLLIHLTIDENDLDDDTGEREFINQIIV